MNPSTLQLPPIVQVWAALGGGPLQVNRGKPFWRKSNGRPNVSINSERQSWYDFGTSVGGGVLDLVCVALNNPSRRAAVQWLADNCGMRLGPDTETPEERAARVKAAKHKRDQVKLWRQGVIDRLEEMQRRGLADGDLKAVAYAAPRLRKLREVTPADLERLFDKQPVTQRKADISAARKTDKVWDSVCLTFVHGVVRGVCGTNPVPHDSDSAVGVTRGNI